MKKSTPQVFIRVCHFLQTWTKFRLVFTFCTLTLTFQLITFASFAQYTKLHDFDISPDGSSPLGSLVSDGTFLYGMTRNGGINNKGTVFKIKTDGTGYTKLLDFDGFTGTANGSGPNGSLIFDGTFLYGMTVVAGTLGGGTIFRIMPDGTGYTKLLDFEDITTGKAPMSSLLFDGIFLYGTTSAGGTANCGVIFKIKPDGTGYSKLIDFAFLTTGCQPRSSLISDGTFLYGTTFQGGPSGAQGTSFKIRPDGTGYAQLLTFNGVSTGRDPHEGFIYDGTFLYGVTSLGGTTDDGTIFKVKPDGTGYAKLLDFEAAVNGENPAGSLITDGTSLYGMTSNGGINSMGTIFKIKPDGTGYTKMLDFAGASNGSTPGGSLNSDGTFLYGMTSNGGANGMGTIFKYALAPTALPTITSFTPVSGPIATTVTITGTNFSATPTNNTVRFNGTLAIVTASSTTSITTTVPSGASTGTITVTVAGNTATSGSNFTVTTPAITITTQPSDHSTCAGGMTTFTTVASGTTNITYQWQFASVSAGPYTDITNGGGYSNATASTLSINTAGNFGAGSYRCKVSGDLDTDKFSNTATLTVNTIPAAPNTTGATGCAPVSMNLTASGGANGQYRWYTTAVGGTPITGEVNGSYTTPVINSSATYYVVIYNGTCESMRTSVLAQVKTPNAPTVLSTTACAPASVTLTAAGGVNGQYRWYTVATGGTSIAGELNSSYVTSLLSIATTYYVAIDNSICESTRTPIMAQVNTVPNAPTAVSTTACQPASVTLTATGGVDGQYRWYTVATGGTSIAGELNSIYVTPLLNIATTYYVTIDNNICESTRTHILAQINIVPNAPNAVSTTACQPASVTLTATGGVNGQYRWYTVATGGTSIAGELNSSYTTPSLSIATTYYVTIDNGICESVRKAVLADIITCSANLPPSIIPASTVTQIDEKVTLNLALLISDPDNNLDLSTLKIITQPGSKAFASIDSQSNLIVDYRGISFAGKDRLTIEVCDLASSCAQQEIIIEVEGDIIVYSAISPNGDGKNDIWIIKNIHLLEDTRFNHVLIFNRWGDAVFETANYDNLNRLFNGRNKNGSELPAGTYYYKIAFASGRKSLMGYISLKR